MRRRTTAAVVAVCAILASLALFGLFAGPSGQLTSEWVSDTPRQNSVNHHAVGVGPAGDVILAPVAEVPRDEVTMTRTSCSLVQLRPSDGATLWQTEMPPEDCVTHALTEPAIADIDGDKRLEALISTTEDALIAYETDTGDEQWRVTLDTYGYGRPTVADLPLGPGPEVITSDISGGVVAVHGNGTVAWRRSLNETGWERTAVWQAPTVDDFDADGTPEILVGSNSGPVLLSATGDIEWKREGGATYTAAARVDDDPEVELFTADSGGIRAYDGRTGALDWEREFTDARIRTATDGDGDGTVELYVGRLGGEVVALDARTGETEWRTTVVDSDDTTVAPPVLGDVNGDGTPEVVVTLNDGTVAVLGSKTGSQLALYERPVPVWTFPTLADIDDDGAAEILTRYGDGRVVALSYAEREGPLRLSFGQAH
ncbi:MAG: PQQ-binding-like beta-propeller repeat protein [Halobacteriales archaeon]|nr:PQQ-binding-like beta-propeller repeat protein [Halobacteriales archaeon]